MVPPCTFVYWDLHKEGCGGYKNSKVTNKTQLFNSL